MSEEEEEEEWDLEAKKMEFDANTAKWFFELRMRGYHINCFATWCPFGPLNSLDKSTVSDIYFDIVSGRSKPVYVPLKTISCKRCKFARYCSRKCLVSNWQHHQNVCWSLEELCESMNDYEASLKCYASENGRKINLFTKEIGRFSQFPEARKFCTVRAEVAEQLWNLALEYDFAYLWEESAMHYQEILRLGQDDFLGLVDIIPAILIGAKEYRKAYIFCLWWAHADKNYHELDWPYEDDVEPESWIWGPICCDKRTFDDPFEIDEDEHEDMFESIEADDYRVHHLVAMALVKHIEIYDPAPDEDELYTEAKMRQPKIIERIFKEINRRNDKILKSVLNPDPFLKLFKKIDVLKEHTKSMKTAEDSIRLYSFLYKKYEALSRVQKALT